ncbi:NUDIX hydrolase [Nocardioides sp.]|uniref:NUDIX hydrolase n=1 Tax=Nocardioides sp. TaxID=35761 RepID=UPI00286E6FF4|nr:NUDIX hydrolase [Nocardioides sp.]
MDIEALADRPASWPVKRSRDLHRDAWIVALREDVITRPGHPGDEFVRISLEHPGAVVILAVDDDERVLCLRQYRHTNQSEFVELPAGLRDAAGEPSVETAKRELREEAELAATSWQLLLSTFASAGISEEAHDIFLARGLSPAPRGDFEMVHEEAEMEVFWAPMADLLDAVLDGRVRQGPLAQAVLAYDVLKRREGLESR